MRLLQLSFRSSPAFFPTRCRFQIHLFHHPQTPQILRFSSPHSASTLSFSAHLTSTRRAAVAGGDEACQSFDEDLSRLLILLPEEMRARIQDHPDLQHLVEIVMDLGRRPLARFPSGDFVLSDRPITVEDIRHASSQVGDFAADNRAGICRTLHRVSAIRNRKGEIIGLTCRVGRAVSGSANLLREFVKDRGSLLLIGPPGVGKTTIIREIARMLADDFKKRVMIVDTSNEIGGDGDVPHSGIGSARRLQVPNSDMQHKEYSFINAVRLQRRSTPSLQEDKFLNYTFQFLAFALLPFCIPCSFSSSHLLFLYSLSGFFCRWCYSNLARENVF